MSNFLNIKLILFFAALLVSSCDFEYYADEDECEYPDYSDCNTIEPFFGNLQIKSTINQEYTVNYVTLYEGFVEENIVFKEIDVTENLISVEVPVDRRFSAKALYIKGIDTIAVIDGTFVKKNDKQYCDSVCWSLSGLELDLRLK